MRIAVAGTFVVSSLFLFISSCSESDEPTGCSPLCSADACMVCDTSGSNPVCRTACGTGLNCQAGQCIPEAEITCAPACGDCQVCDTSGADGVCVRSCGEGTVCNAGVCEPQPVVTCDPACGPCQGCDLSGAAPVCTDLCSDGTACANGVCAPTETVRTGFHTNFLDLAGPFDSGPDVTAKCVSCHQAEANEFILTAHWRWTGPTPGLVGHENETTIGKKNLINNFCIAIDANEARCTQCHAGYGWGAPASNNNPTFDFVDTSRIDCLVCHADPKAVYKKDKKTAGNVPVDDTGKPIVDLAIAAQSVGSPEIANCGACHFFAGGGDNVKKGDLGSALLVATKDDDVHMGRGIQCANCHAGDAHHILGQGVHLPINEGRVRCEDCHSAAPHDNVLLDDHALDVACETCHIPAFSRKQPTKMFWDWSLAGDRTRTPVMTNFSGAERPDYDWMKGEFVWEMNVQPSFAWYDGNVSHLTVTDRFTEEGTSAAPVVIAAPTATYASPNAKIHPFKLMRGRQAADTTQNFLIVPDLFGPGSFWGVLGAPTQAGTNHSYTEDPAIWNTMLTTGARAAGQIADTEAYGVDRTWHFVDTVMYMGINHEVAPKEEALFCTSCHGPEGRLDFQAMGYGCDPVMDDPVTCGSRHTW